MKPFQSFVPPLAAMLLAASGGAVAQGVLIDKSEIRFVSGTPSRWVAVTVEMASPRPSPWTTVPVWARDRHGATETTCTVTRETTPCTLSVHTGPDGVVHIMLRSSTWSRPGATPDRGVFVKRVVLASVTHDS